MQQFLAKSRLKYGLQAVQIEEAWEKIMGKTVAKYTDKIEIVKSTLFVTTAVAPLKNELIYQTNTIIDRVNAELGQGTITKVVIQ